MSNSLLKNKVPYDIYVVINKCQGLPEFRGDKEKQKNILRKWQVIFHETEESRATPLVEGLTDVSWMCETFLKLKSTNKPFWMSVVDDRAQIAGKTIIDWHKIPVGDKKLLRPGQQFDGSRDAYRNLQPMQEVILISTNEIKSILSFWIWGLTFKEKVKEISNLEKLMFLSKSATSLFKSPSIVDINIDDSVDIKHNRNPFEPDNESYNGSDLPNHSQSKNPFINYKGRASKFGSNDIQIHPCPTLFFDADTVGKSSFARFETTKFRNSILIPKYDPNTQNLFSNLTRTSSLPLLKDLSENQDESYGAEEFKMDLYRKKLSFSVPCEELDDFRSLGQCYNIKLDIKDEHLIESARQDYFSLLNDLQRRYASKVLRIKELEMKNGELRNEIKHVSSTFYKLKTKLINNNLIDMLEGINLDE